METKIYETSQTDSKLNGLNENKIISSLTTTQREVLRQCSAFSLSLLDTHLNLRPGSTGLVLTTGR